MGREEDGERVGRREVWGGVRARCVCVHVYVYVLCVCLCHVRVCVLLHV